MALTISLTPGIVVNAGDTITEDVLNALANPTVELEGTIATSTIGDGSITLVKLITGILSADSAGRSRMADGFIIGSKISATLDLGGKTITGAVTMTLTGTLDFSGATVNLGGSNITLPVGAVVQFVNTSYVTYTNITATIPLNDNKPQISAGTQILSVAITPKTATNKLIIRVVLRYCGNTGYPIAALFQNSDVDALAAGIGGGAGGIYNELSFEHVMVGGSGAQTFTVRVGAAGAGNLYLNGDATARKLGGVSACTLSITEIAAT